jgi:predicted acylesterase/phospholipase RssA
VSRWIARRFCTSLPGASAWDGYTATGLPGGSSHTAFTAGVLARLLSAPELRNTEFLGLSGTSGGASRDRRSA